ncbi:unnamed protein product, partial [Didymodactylos carnosus]
MLPSISTATHQRGPLSSRIHILSPPQNFITRTSAQNVPQLNVGNSHPHHFDVGGSQSEELYGACPVSDTVNTPFVQSICIYSSPENLPWAPSWAVVPTEMSLIKNNYRPMLPLPWIHLFVVDEENVSDVALSTGVDERESEVELQTE